MALQKLRYGCNSYPSLMKFYCDDMRHLVCVPYSIANLHLMAKELDIKRCWFHNAKHKHYDIPKRRIEEIRVKCIIVGPRDILLICNGTFECKVGDEIGENAKAVC